MIRWARAVILAVSATAIVTSATTVSAPSAVAHGRHQHPHSSQGLLRKVGQFYLGDSTNPLFAALTGDCGQLIHGVFYMAAPIDVGVELDCTVPAWTPIVLSPAAWFATQGIDGDTDQELEAAAAAGFNTSTDWLTLDGKNVPLRTTITGAYDVRSEPGSFYDAILSVGTGRIRTAIVGNVVLFRHLSRGDHVIESAVSFVPAGNGDYSATYHIHVGGWWSRSAERI
jgi:hypothetical protein